jgi:oligo-1,6-glucosidase
MMAGLLMTMRGTPYMHEGQEIGMTNGDFQNLEEIQDVESHTVWAMAKRLGIPKGMRWKMIRRTSRDNGRTPMQWDDSENAGFTTGKPWLKVNGNYKTVNAAREVADDKGVLSFWKYMISLRKSEPALREGDYHPAYMKGSVYAFERVLGGKRLLTVCNFSAKTVKLPVQLAQWDNVVASNYDDLTPMLRPFEFRLMQEEVENCD